MMHKAHCRARKRPPLPVPWTKILITEDGEPPSTYQKAREALVADVCSALGPAVDTTPTSVMGGLISAFAAQMANLHTEIEVLSEKFAALEVKK